MNRPSKLFLIFVLTSFFAVNEELNMPGYKNGAEKKIPPTLIRSEEKKGVMEKEKKDNVKTSWMFIISWQRKNIRD